GISSPLPKFLAACATGNLPAVSFVDPRFEDEGSGTSGDDHPHADIRVGQSFLNQIYQAVTSSPAWGRTVFVINYDEWGGFFDHVAPATAPDANPANGLRGFRVPALVISPRARRRTVASGTYDHTSVLKMIEWRWGLPALTPRDAATANLAEVLDFHSAPDLTAPRWNVPTVVPTPCAPAVPATAAVPTEHELTWAALAAKARSSGFTLP
ncbi:MAG: alkaline phosphatase family protein, partial [Acidimicrobiales bacterium]